MILNCLTLGELQTNCYLVSENNSDKCLIIDPADDADFISSEILRLKLNPSAIILTHGHFDHCLATLELKLNFNTPIYLHQDDLFLYQRATETANHFTSTKHLKLPSPNFYLEDNQKIHINPDDTSSEYLKVIHTPGHTPGSISLYNEQKGNPILLSGDTVFADGIGATNHKYSSSSQLWKSLSKLKKLPRSTQILSGHGDPIFLSDCPPIQGAP